MDAKILHLLDDRQVGGINTALTCLMQSRLQDEFAFSVADTAEAAALLERHPFDLVITHNPCSWRSLPRFLRLKKYKSKILIHEHHYSAGFERWHVTARRRFHLMLRIFYRLADCVVAVSHGQARWMQENKLVSPERLVVIQQSHTLDDLLQLPILPLQSPVVLAAYGRFVPAKGFADLIHALKQLPSNTCQIRIGGYGPEEAYLKQLAQGQTNVEFYGLVRNLAEFLRLCDGVIIPSRMEPWGNVCVEAKAAAKPVLASAVDGLPEQMEACGLLAATHDPTVWATTISQFVLLLPHQRHTWGKNGREEVRYAWETYLSHWETLLREMTTRRGLSLHSPSPAERNRFVSVS